jgi:hypothetical protein
MAAAPHRPLGVAPEPSDVPVASSETSTPGVPRPHAPERQQPDDGRSVSTGQRPPESPQALSFLFDLVKAEVEMQAKVTERFDAKARGALVLAAGLFTAVQAIALRNDVVKALGGSERFWLFFFAALAAFSVLIALLSTLWATAPISEDFYDPDRMRERLQGIHEHYADEALVNSYISLAQLRQDHNGTRFTRLRVVQLVTAAAIILLGAELIVALLALTNS